MEATIADIDQTPRCGKSARISRAGNPLVQRTPKWDKHEEHEQTKREFQCQSEIAHSKSTIESVRGNLARGARSLVRQINLRFAVRQNQFCNQSPLISGLRVVMTGRCNHATPWYCQDGSMYPVRKVGSVGRQKGYRQIVVKVKQ